MLQNFFKLNAPFAEFNEAQLAGHFKNSKDLRAVLYKPDLWPKDLKRIDAGTFSNVSLSKTKLSEITFNKCRFEDCLFIGTVFKNVEFHSCEFINCNFYKSEVERCYLDPRSIIFSETYKQSASNIGVSLFQKLLENATTSRQAQHAMLSDFRFRQWKRAQLAHDQKDGKITKKQAWVKWLGSIIYEFSCGFGYSPLRLIITTLMLFLIVSTANIWIMADGLLVDGKTVNHLHLSDSVFYTFSLLTSLGFSTVIPSLPHTKIAAVLQALMGIGWLSLFTSVLVRRFLK